MKCITRYDMKFGDIIVPARTECKVVNKIHTSTVNAPGVRLNIVIENWDIKIKDVENENEVIKFYNNVNKATLRGIYISTNTESVYMYADDYMPYRLYDWEIEKIFGEKDKIPTSLVSSDRVDLFHVIDYLEEEFADWVHDNCEFRFLTEEDIEQYGYEAFEVGDTTLSECGLQMFEEKCFEYKKKIETIGFTYEFKGGLIWSN